MKIITRPQIVLLCLWVLFVLSGTAGAGVVDDAEEVLTTVRGKGAVSRQVRSGFEVSQFALDSAE